MRNPVLPVDVRFLRHVDKNGPVPPHRPDLGPCWLWTAKPDKDGYGLFRVGGRDGRKVLAHRVSFDLWVRLIPAGMTVDHVCRNRACVNPTHLEAVTQQENNERAWPFIVHKTHCKHGHLFDSVVGRGGGKTRQACKTCTRDAQARCIARRRERSA